MPTKRFLILSLLPVFLAGLAWAGRSLWLPSLGRFLVASQQGPAPDALVVLAGDGERITLAAQAFPHSGAQWFVVTDMPLRLPGVRDSYAELSRREAVWNGVPEERILIVPGLAETTYDEAVLLRQLAEEQGWRSLRIATSNFHTRRSRLIFNDVFQGSGVALSIQPLPVSYYDPSRWWFSQDSLRETWTEYLKLLLYALGYH